MKIKFFLPILVLLLPFHLLAVETITQDKDRKLVDERRVEEEKRESLRHTEATPEAQEKKEIPADKQAPQDMLENAYLMDLMQRRVTYGYDAAKAVVLINKVENEYLDLNAQIAYLKEKKILPRKYHKEFDPMKPLRKGLFAYMLCKTLNIKGGIALHTLGKVGFAERYSLKELAFEGIMADSNRRDLVRGDELATAMMQAKGYLGKK